MTIKSVPHTTDGLEHLSTLLSQCRNPGPRSLALGGDGEILPGRLVCRGSTRNSSREVECSRLATFKAACLSVTVYWPIVGWLVPIEVRPMDRASVDLSASALGVESPV
jgi:hypothetical protein